MEYTSLGLRWIFVVVCCLAAATALPASIVEDVKSEDASNMKVKRAQTLSTSEESPKEPAGYFGPTAIKRGINMKTEQLPLLSDWDKQRYRPVDSIPSPLFTPEDELDDKSLAEYEKGFRYGTSKDKLDEALENAILKSELYGDQAALNQYRYYGNEEDRRRKRRNALKIRTSNRFKRQDDLSPEDILAILTLWESERERAPLSTHRSSWQHLDNPYDNSDDNQEVDNDRADDDWMDGPVYPHVSEHIAPMSPNYYYDVKPEQQVFEKRGRWNGLAADNRKKRFMVAKKRGGGDPTRELRYLNGPSRNDYYTLSELLGNQREPNVPVYQRYVL